MEVSVKHITKIIFVATLATLVSPAYSRTVFPMGPILADSCFYGETSVGPGGKNYFVINKQGVVEYFATQAEAINYWYSNCQTVA
jgi:hypothetical protein